MAYRKVYFRIRTEGYASGWSSDSDRSAFKEESRPGTMQNKTKKACGSSPTRVPKIFSSTPTKTYLIAKFM